MRLLEALKAAAIVVLITNAALSAADSEKTAGALNASTARSMDSEDFKIVDYLVRHRNEMMRVTPELYHVVSKANPFRCSGPSVTTIPPPHGQHWIHVFVSPTGIKAMTLGEGAYPEGTIILKQKFLDPQGARTEFYTGMRKREKGYNSEMSDWEFFTLNSTGLEVTSRGKIESCMNCHADYQRTDFVTREYLTVKFDSWR